MNDDLVGYASVELGRGNLICILKKGDNDIIQQLFNNTRSMNTYFFSFHGPGLRTADECVLC